MTKKSGPSPQREDVADLAFRFPSERQWRRANVSRLLFSAAWRFDSRILDYVNKHGFPALRMAHLHVPRNLDLEGTRITALAARAEMSKQAMAEIVDECAAMGLVRRTPDQNDRRAKIVQLTSRGLRLMKTVRAALASAQQEMRAILGPAALDAVTRALATYVEGELRGGEPRWINRSR